MKLFVTDYASYNNGTQFEFGHWVDLTDHLDAEDLFEYINDHLEKADKKSPLLCGSKREEIMFTDYEGFPSVLYNESMGVDDVQKIYDLAELLESDYNVSDFDSMSDSDWISLNNDYNPNDYIYNNDEDDLIAVTGDNIVSAIQMTTFGDYNYMHDYFIINGYGNLDSFDEYEVINQIDKSEVINQIIENL